MKVPCNYILVLAFCFFTVANTSVADDRTWSSDPEATKHYSCKDNFSTLKITFNESIHLKPNTTVYFQGGELLEEKPADKNYVQLRINDDPLWGDRTVRVIPKSNTPIKLSHRAVLMGTATFMDNSEGEKAFNSLPRIGWSETTTKLERIMHIEPQPDEPRGAYHLKASTKGLSIVPDDPCMSVKDMQKHLGERATVTVPTITYQSEDPNSEGNESQTHTSAPESP